MDINGSHHPGLCLWMFCVEGIRHKTQGLTPWTLLPYLFTRPERYALDKLAVCGAWLEG